MKTTKEMIMSNLFKDLGVNPSLLGYRYLKAAVQLQMSTPDYVRNITKKLYPEVAKMYNTTSVRVERAMRHAIEKAWPIGNPLTVQKVFGYTVDSFKGKPTNSSFVATVAEYLTLYFQENINAY